MTFIRTFPIFLFLFAFIGANFLASAEQKDPPILTFTDLKNPSPYQGQMVVIRGFIYQTPEGDWIMAETPNLKTCCIGTTQKIDRQIVVFGEFKNPGPGLAVTLLGRFDAKPKRDPKGNIKSLYHITEGVIITPEGDIFNRAITL